MKVQFDPKLNFFSQPIPFTSFLHHLTSSMDTGSTSCVFRGGDEQIDLEAYICFTHWVPLAGQPTMNIVRTAAKRCAALVMPPGFRAIDFVIPLVDSADNLCALCLVQGKNRQEDYEVDKNTEKMAFPPHHPLSALPYFRLYLQVGDSRSSMEIHPGLIVVRGLDGLCSSFMVLKPIIQTILRGYRDVDYVRENPEPCRKKAPMAFESFTFVSCRCSSHDCADENSRCSCRLAGEKCHYGCHDSIGFQCSNIAYGCD